MLETSIAYLLSMEIGRDLLEVPSNIFKIKGKTGPKSFQIQQCRWQGDRITFSPSKVVSDYAVFFIHGKDEGDNCITVPYQEVRAGIEAGEIETATIVPIIVHKIRIDAETYLLPHGDGIVPKK
jgi:hypothetical protein